MRIFALETDIGEVKRRFCHEGEHEVLMTYYHGLSFLFAILREMMLTLVLFGLGTAFWLFGFPMLWIVLIFFCFWLSFVFFNVLKAYIDWCFDFILVTTDKIILADQTSIFRQEVRPIHVENIGSVSAFTQFWNIFPFGGISIHLKEGLGGDDIVLKYVPRALDVAGKISEVVTRYQRATEKRMESGASTTRRAPG